MLRRTGTARDERDQGGEIRQADRQGSAERLVTIAAQTLRTDAIDRPVPRRRANSSSRVPERHVVGLDEALRPDARWLLVNVHDAGHERMHAADVGEVSFLVEPVLEPVIRVEAF